MTEIGIIGGTGFSEWEEFEIDEKMDEDAPWGTPSSPIYKGTIKGTEVYFLRRHGERHDIPPHRINHRANIYVLQRYVKDIIGLSSVGALDEDIPVPSVSIPEDYVNFWNATTFYDESIKHATPELSQGLRGSLIDSAENTGVSAREEDVYVMTSGPRLETQAEVKILASFGDLVGMTLAPEATLCKETGLKYASVVTADNYANGINQEVVDYEEIKERARDNFDRVKNILEDMLKRR